MCVCVCVCERERERERERDREAGRAGKDRLRAGGRGRKVHTCIWREFSVSLLAFCIMLIPVIFTSFGLVLVFSFFSCHIQN